LEEQIEPLLTKILESFNKNHRDEDIEKVLEIYSHELLDSGILEGTTYYIEGDKGVFKAEGLNLKKLYSITSDRSGDPIAHFLKNLLEFASKRRVKVSKVNEDDFKTVYNIEVTPEEITIPNEAEEEDFNEMLSEALKEGTESLGPFINGLLFVHLEKKYDIRKEEVVDVKVLHGALGKILGEGSQIIELNVAKRLYAKLGKDFQEKPGWELEDYVEEARKEKNA